MSKFWKQNPIKRREKPDFSYERKGERYEVPWVMGVMAGLSGEGQEAGPIGERGFIEVDFDSFGGLMKAIRPRVVVEVADRVKGAGGGGGVMKVELEIGRLEDFEPVGVVGKVPALKELMVKRGRLVRLAGMADGRMERPEETVAAAELLALANDREKRRWALGEEEGVIAFCRRVQELLGEANERRLPEVVMSVRAFAEVAGEVGVEGAGDFLRVLERLIGWVDGKLSWQLNEIMHHAEFVRMEAAWRGLFNFVANVETSERLKIKVLNVSKKELSREMKKYAGETWDQSVLFKKLHDDVFGVSGGEPFGCLIGDYYFDDSPADLEELKGLGRMGAACGCVFLAGADAGLAGVKAWGDLLKGDGWSGVTESAAWQSFREMEEARWVGLVGPRYLARSLWGKDGWEGEGTLSGFEETKGRKEALVWANSAYLMGQAVCRGWKLDGWGARVEGREHGGVVSLALSTSHEELRKKGEGIEPLEVMLDERLEGEIGKLGFSVLVEYKGRRRWEFGYAFSHARTAWADGPTVGDVLGRMLVASRYVQVMKCMVRDWEGERSAGAYKAGLDAWVRRHVGTGAEGEDRGKWPLGFGMVMVKEEGVAYWGELFIEAWHQLERVAGFSVWFVLPVVRG